MSNQTVQSGDISAARARSRLLWAGAAAMLAALAFWAFFQASKWPLFGSANPFADDPVDAIGSIGFEIAVVAGLLSLARAARLRQLGALDQHRPTLILRGGLIVLLALFVTLAADGVMEIQHPGWDVSVWGQALILGLVALAVLGALAGVLLARAARAVAVLPPTRSALGSGWLGEALEDVFLLGWQPVTWFGSHVPLLGHATRWMVGLWRGPLALRLRATLAGVSPWTHPWRFTLLAGLAAGVGLAAAHATEGLPPDLGRVVLVTLVFIGIEFVATVAGFLVLGGFLGLRPPLWTGRRSG
jgi:hypothetical protein